jgi:hypothetical protein
MTDELDASVRLRISPSVYARPFGDELVLLDFGRGEYYGLDSVGAEIWRRLENGETLGAIADAITTGYDVERETAFSDIVRLVGEMRSRALVEVVGGR